MPRAIVSRSRPLLVAVALAVAACGSPAAPPQAVASLDAARARLVGALPEVDGGVYLVDLQRAGDLSPGSRIAPLLAGLVDDAALLLESAMPPVTVLAGVPADVSLPREASRVDDVVVFAGAEIVDVVTQRLGDGAEPDPTLEPLATTDAPVAWAGPSPALDASGRTAIEVSPETVTITVTGYGMPVAAAVAHAEQELTSGAPPGSPGKPWRSVLGEARVTAEDGVLTITAVPADLPGPFLRVLLDGQQLTFLPAER